MQRTHIIEARYASWRQTWGLSSDVCVGFEGPAVLINELIKIAGPSIPT